MAKPTGQQSQIKPILKTWLVDNRKVPKIENEGGMMSFSQSRRRKLAHLCSVQQRRSSLHYIEKPSLQPWLEEYKNVHFVFF